LEGRLPEKANQRFDPAALAAISRIFAREAALKVSQEGMRWMVGAWSEAASAGEPELAALEAALNLPAIHRSQAGLMRDMDFIADVLYGRAAKPAAHVA
jgi:hypothetical protein